MPSTALYVIALISGGKDSFFSLLHCLENGHRVVALANLYPGSEVTQNDEGTGSSTEGEDLNSFMYQTVGHTIVPLYADALKLPLYRGQIRGNAVNKCRDYVRGNQNGPDETEDLVPLLQRIQQAHPEANAISTGAILSTYQRTRIESVALRLRLTPLAYLWQYPALPPPPGRGDSATGLLDDMEVAGCDARLIKIASGGISESLLWSRVSDPSCRIRLENGMSSFGNEDDFSRRGAILGEGGEYETLTLNGPTQVWKGRIQVNDGSAKVIRDPGGVVRLAIGEATLVQQTEDLKDDTKPLLRIPGLFDDKFKQLAEGTSGFVDRKGAAVKVEEIQRWNCPELHWNASQTQSNITINNLTSATLPSDIRAQTRDIFSQLDQLMIQNFDHRSGSSCVIFTTVILRHMADFSTVNSCYAERFAQGNPPARISICCGGCLPDDALLSMSFSLTKVTASRISTLHVQSLSYWAPANIGPYSQAMSVPVSAEEWCCDEVVHLAGQIPLLPSSMELMEADFIQQAVLSLQHLWRVGQSVKIDWWIHVIAYLADAGFDEVQKRASLACEIWSRAVAEQETDRQSDDSDEDDSIDLWNLKYNHHHRLGPQRTKLVSNSHLHTLPKYKLLERAPSPFRTHRSSHPPFLAAHISSLPRSAPIEWQTLGLSCMSSKNFNRNNDGPRLTVTTTTENESSISTCRLQPSKIIYAESDSSHLQPTSKQIAELGFFSVQIFTTTTTTSSSSSSSSTSPPQSSLNPISKHLNKAISNLLRDRDQDSKPCWALTDLTIYVSSQAGYDAVNSSSSDDTSSSLAETSMLIPCHSLWGEQGRRVEVAILGRREKS